MANKIYTVRSNGKVFKIRGPEGATPEQLQAQVQGAQIAAPQAQEPSFLDQLQQAGGQAREQLAQINPIADLGLRAREAVGSVFDKGGEALAETLAGPGLSAQPLLGLPGLPSLPAPAQPGEDAIRTSPEVAAGIGTGVSMVPDVAEAFLGGGAGILGKRAGQEALRKAFTSRGIGAQIGEAERAAGISKRLTTTKALKDQLQIPGKGDFTTVANKVDELLSSGAQLPKQFLSDFRVALKKALNTPAFSKGEPQALLLNIKDKADDAFNLAVPGRAELSKRFSKAKGREQLLGSIKSGAKKGAIGLGGLEILRRVLGQ